MLEACIHTGTHYLGISNDITDLKKAYDRDEKLKKAKVLAIPGAGFGIAPTDIISHMAIQQIDNPTKLTIAYSAQGKFPRSLKKYFLNQLPKTGYIISGGKMKPAVAACKKKKFNVFGLDFEGVYNPWRADLLSSYKKSGIENIEVYSAFSPFGNALMEGKFKWLQKLMTGRLSNLIPQGPSKEDLEKGRTYIKVEVTNNQHEKVSVELLGPDSNIFTIECLYEILVCSTNEQKTYGVKTPAELDEGFLGRIQGVKMFSNFERRKANAENYSYSLG